jgi:3-hydroxy acid dehydrogenase/malonic semialdehyde reductase
LGKIFKAQREMRGIGMLQGKIVFITGATSGIGLACAHQFARAGAKLLLCARRIELLHELAEQLHKQYQLDIHVFQLDVSQAADVKASLNTLPATWSHIDIVINNAGLAAGLDTFQEGKLDDWEAMIDINVKGLLYVTKEILPGMIARNAGHIINIGSIAGHQTYPKGAVYCATKAAVTILSNGLRMDLSGTKIRVSTVDPGAVETNFSMVRFKGDAQRAAAVYQGMQPLTAEDVADAVVFCASRPAHVNISEVIIMPTDQASATIVSRKDNR